MFNLGIQDTLTEGMNERKREWNWNANQDKQTLYTTADLTNCIQRQGNN